MSNVVSEIMGSFLLFIMVLLSHGTLKVTLNNYANNATLVNPIILFFNSWFSLFWATLAIFLLILTLYFILENKRH